MHRPTSNMSGLIPSKSFPLADQVEDADVGSGNVGIAKSGKSTDGVAKRKDATIVPHEVVVHLFIPTIMLQE